MVDARLGLSRGDGTGGQIADDSNDLVPGYRHEIPPPVHIPGVTQPQAECVSIAEHLMHERPVHDDRSRGRAVITRVEPAPGQDWHLERVEETRTRMQDPREVAHAGLQRRSGVDLDRSWILPAGQSRRDDHAQHARLCFEPPDQLRDAVAVARVGATRATRKPDADISATAICSARPSAAIRLRDSIRKADTSSTDFSSTRQLAKSWRLRSSWLLHDVSQFSSPTMRSPSLSGSVG
jgi:hypothetical protein